VPFEYIEYKLCEKFSCLPSNLDEQSWEKIDNFLRFINLDNELQKKEQRLSDNKSKKRFPG